MVYWAPWLSRRIGVKEALKEWSEGSSAVVVSEAAPGLSNE